MIIKVFIVINKILQKISKYERGSRWSVDQLEGKNSPNKLNERRKKS